MESIAQAAGNRLEWIQPSMMQRHFELRSGDTLFGTLQFKSAWGSLAYASSTTGTWTFKRVGFFSPRVTVRREGEERDFAIYRPKWTGTEGELTFSFGMTSRWKVTNFWATQFAFLWPNGQPVVTFSSGTYEPKLSDALKYQVKVEIAPAAANLPELPLLVMLGWYLVILHMDDSAAGASAAAAAA